MEYCANQNVVYEQDGKNFTGQIVGHSGGDFIVLLDKHQQLADGSRAVLVPSGIVRPLTCHWCQDTKKVYSTPITGAQLESGDIPQKECPYCTDAHERNLATQLP